MTSSAAALAASALMNPSILMVIRVESVCATPRRRTEGRDRLVPYEQSV
jgi:hypothetical protein